MIPFPVAAALLLLLIASVAVACEAVPGLRARAVRATAGVIAALAALAVGVTVVMASFATAATVRADDSSPGGESGAAEVAEAEPAEAAEAGVSDPSPLPDGFSYVADLAPGVDVELRYATTENFTGQVVDGYESEDAAILRTEPAAALALVQQDLEAEGLGLRVYDAFRPTRAVQFFMDWAQTDDDRTKSEYYPDFEKPQLFELGYIAEKSGHSLGGTVDLTLVDLETGEALDMGGPFDFFGERSHYETAGLTPEQIDHRATLHDAMLARGFEQYPLEWWHYSYPLPDDTAREDFVVR